MPHSRHTEVKESEIRAVDGLYILSSSPIAGTNIVSNHNGRQIFIFGHSEYEANTLAEEYFRDLGKLDNVELPYHYFPDVTRHKNQSVPGAATPTCSIPTGLTTTSTSPPHMTFAPCGWTQNNILIRKWNCHAL